MFIYNIWEFVRFNHKTFRTKSKLGGGRVYVFTLVFPVLVLNCCLTNHPKFSLKQQTHILSVFVDQGPECGLAGGIQLRVVHKAAVCV